jgi:hypothetical protein
MSISKYIVHISSVKDLVKQLLVTEFKISEEISEELSKGVQPHFDNLRDSIYIFAETSYVDKVYRDSYYHYYSSKNNPYNRFCIRLSLFDGQIDDSQFNKAGKDELQNKYRGFIIIRPTEPQIIGRSVISPKALKDEFFHSCAAKFESSINGVKLTVEGFPHSSQDAETISCAETTLWGIMEYFSHKYEDYTPLLPSKIISLLKKITFERQLPSDGLDIHRISLVLREAGFGSKIYSERTYGADVFNRILRTYVNSGIPIISAVDNFHVPNGTIGHALITVGFRPPENSKIDNIPERTFASNHVRSIIQKNNIKFYDWDDLERDLVFIDDNFPAYQKRPLSDPASGYNDVSWNGCKIKHFIVPLHSKIYLEAYVARGFISKFLLMGPSPLKINSQVLIRFFLASSRSFKENVSLNELLNPDIKDFILEYAMPKFIWVAELSNKELIKQNPPLADGLIILDATEANVEFNKPLILASYQDKMIVFDKDNKLEENSLSIAPFHIYSNNLKNHLL